MRFRKELAMAAMQIQLIATGVDSKPAPGPPGLGKTFIFTNDVAYNGQAVGTHSGTVRTVRKVKAGDVHVSFPASAQDGELLEYEATYTLNAQGPNGPTGLQAGQITARGVFLITGAGTVQPVVFAITGGTAAYAHARGQIAEQGTLRALDLEL
jgi:hypothetical protein